MSWLRRLVHKPEHSINPGSSSSDPPEWSAAPEPIHALGLYNEATDDSYESAEQFCDEHPQDPPKLLPSRIVDAITERGCAVWGFEVPEMFSRRERGRVKWRGGIENVGEVKGKSQGVVRMWSEEGCRDVCLLSDVPILGGLYDTRGKQGVYFEVLIKKMEGVIAIGTACRPYPAWRLPGWNRSSVGLHLDDLRKFFEDPDGGRDYLSPLLPSHISPGDTIGCAYEFSSSSVFFTYNGLRLPSAFSGLYLPRSEYDVYAAIGFDGGGNEVEVNFGGGLFRWKEGNEWAWRVEGHLGSLGGGSGIEEELPSYDEARGG